MHDVCTIPHRRSTVLHRRLSYASSLPTSLRRPLPAKEHGEVSFLVAASSLAEDNPAATLYRRWASPPSPSVPNRTTAMLFAASTVCGCLSLACVMKPHSPRHCWPRPTPEYSTRPRPSARPSPTCATVPQRSSPPTPAMHDFIALGRLQCPQPSIRSPPASDHSYNTGNPMFMTILLPWARKPSFSQKER